jgi:hypothetical protein
MKRSLCVTGIGTALHDDPSSAIIASNFYSVSSDKKLIFYDWNARKTDTVLFKEKMISSCCSKLDGVSRVFGLTFTGKVFSWLYSTEMSDVSPTVIHSFCEKDWPSNLDLVFLAADDFSGILVVVVPNKLIRIISTRFTEKVTLNNLPIDETSKISLLNDAVAVGFMELSSVSRTGLVCSIWGVRSDEDVEEVLVFFGNETWLDVYRISIRISDGSITNTTTSESESDNGLKEDCQKLLVVKLLSSHTAWITAVSQGFQQSVSTSSSSSSTLQYMITGDACGRFLVWEFSKSTENLTETDQIAQICCDVTTLTELPIPITAIWMDSSNRYFWAADKSGSVSCTYIENIENIENDANQRPRVVLQKKRRLIINTIGWTSELIWNYEVNKREGILRCYSQEKGVLASYVLDDSIKDVFQVGLDDELSPLVNVSGQSVVNVCIVLQEWGILLIGEYEYALVTHVSRLYCRSFLDWCVKRIGLGTTSLL